jgi:hypothetical protein
MTLSAYNNSSSCKPTDVILKRDRYTVIPSWRIYYVWLNICKTSLTHFVSYSILKKFTLNLCLLWFLNYKKWYAPVFSSWKQEHPCPIDTFLRAHVWGWFGWRSRLLVVDFAFSSNLQSLTSKLIFSCFCCQQMCHVYILLHNKAIIIC